jgi:hypothetical protein
MPDQKTPVPPIVRKYMSQMGMKGGRIGGKAKGKRKARSADHYAKMVARRNEQRARTREAEDFPAPPTVPLTSLFRPWRPWK